MEKRNCTNYEAKTKALINCAVTAQLIRVFVFAYARSRLYHVVDVQAILIGTQGENDKL